MENDDQISAVQLFETYLPKGLLTNNFCHA